MESQARGLRLPHLGGLSRTAPTRSRGGRPAGRFPGHGGHQPASPRPRRVPAAPEAEPSGTAAGLGVVSRAAAAAAGPAEWRRTPGEGRGDRRKRCSPGMAKLREGKCKKREGEVKNCTAAMDPSISLLADAGCGRPDSRVLLFSASAPARGGGMPELLPDEERDPHNTSKASPGLPLLVDACVRLNCSSRARWYG
ncbi:hypothetical protein SORBI_3010G160850 [Sorghum bicolor]|uniref:Uncharacterized protein n=1 Tax=Sorghum bicolor TaxID=4558 RepID=A0A1W0VTE6_SORBI|nr:hypothetical protein SORBI_3010G160850 [Sorghum bicolor]